MTNVFVVYKEDTSTTTDKMPNFFQKVYYAFKPKTYWLDDHGNAYGGGRGTAVTTDGRKEVPRPDHTKRGTPARLPAGYQVDHNRHSGRR